MTEPFSLNQTGDLPESVVFRGYLVFHVSRVKAPRHDVYVGQRRKLFLRHIGLDRGEGLVPHHLFIGRGRHGLLHVLGGHRCLGHDQITTYRCAGILSGGRRYDGRKGIQIRKCVQTEKACQNGSQSLALHEDHCLHISVFCLNVYNTIVAI